MTTPTQELQAAIRAAMNRSAEIARTAIRARGQTIATAPENFYGFPQSAVSASKVGGNDLTVGERPEP
jgi:hypothetical protein